MTSAVVDLLGAGAGASVVGERISTWIERFDAKTVAWMIPVEVRTVFSWRAGNPPQVRHLARMAELWGADFVEFVFQPLLGAPETLDRKLERIETLAARTRRELREGGFDAAQASDRAVDGGVARGDGRAAGAGLPAACGPRPGLAGLGRVSIALILLLVLAAQSGRGRRRNLHPRPRAQTARARRSFGSGRLRWTREARTPFAVRRRRRGWMEGRMSDEGVWIRTASGRRFSLSNLRAEDVSIRDIAHHLANLCRWTGATRRFHSVAQHSLAVSFRVPPELALEGLLHDAAEAYVGDLSRPLRRLLPDFAAIERDVRRAVAHAFGLPIETTEEVAAADDEELSLEAVWLMGADPTDLGLPWPIEPGRRIRVMPPDEAEASFLARFATLIPATVV